MRRITEFFIQRKTFSVVLTLFILGAGFLSYEGLGRLKDPKFTIKTAIVYTPYPGASPSQVEEEVTEKVESAIQQMGEVDEITSTSSEGYSLLHVDMRDKYGPDELPQIWDILRKKLRDARADLPPGAGAPIVNDDFGDVFGVFFAITGDGYTYREIKDYAESLRKELLLVDQVAKVQFFGEQTEAVFIEIPREKLARLGISLNTIVDAVNSQNIISPAGRVEVNGEYISLRDSSVFMDPEDIGNVLIPGGGANNHLYLKDIANIRKDYTDPPGTMLRFNGEKAIGLGISTVDGGNVVVMGNAVKEKLKELEHLKPLGMDINVINYQSETVTKAVNNFVMNLFQAVGIVLGVLIIFMGIKTGFIIGFILLLTILATFIVMKIIGVNLQTISLGALIIALGMLVDNAIVVVEGILVKTQQGMEKVEAAIDSVKETAMPLLGATLIAILAFAAISMSDDSAGEFLASLFQVIAISLLLSWILAITLAPLYSVMLLKTKEGDDIKDSYGGIIFTVYRWTLRLCIRFRWVTILAMFGFLIFSLTIFKDVQQQFFPDEARPNFLINIWMPEGTHIEKTREAVIQLEEHLAEYDEIVNTSSFIGSGALRFILTYSPEDRNDAYAQIMPRVRNYKEIDSLIPRIKDFAEENIPDARLNIKPFTYGPPTGGDVAVRFSGPDPDVLRSLAEKAKDVYRKDPAATFIRDDWRQRTKTFEIEVNEAKAKNAGLTRQEINRYVYAHFNGERIGLFRDKDEFIPIIMQVPEEQRKDFDSVYDMQIMSPALGEYIPLMQVVDSIEPEFQDGLIKRKNRSKTITAACESTEPVPRPLFSRIRADIEAIPLPAGYSMEWGGEYESSRDAQQKLIQNMPLVLMLILLIIVALFNKIRRPIIIFMIIPLAIIGVAWGLVLTGRPFSFTALLGLISLVGMLIKNAIVLIEQIDIELRSGKHQYHAVVDASVSRVRPVSMAAFTTVLGMIPLFTDVFFGSMAVTIMFGLAFATVLTLVILPVLFSIFYGIKHPDREPDKQ